MTISSSHLDALKALGYTEPEARFLYLVAAHSGYFVARQFLGFTGSHWGKRTTTFWAKLHAQKHARTECFPKSGVICHLFSRRLYRQIGRENLRNRREHEIEFIRQRIAMLDFVLANPERSYLETEPEKARFFCEQLKVPSHFLPARTYHGQRQSQPTIRYFVDKFPMFLGEGLVSPPVVTCTFIQGTEANMTEFVHHLCSPAAGSARAAAGARQLKTKNKTKEVVSRGGLEPPTRCRRSFSRNHLPSVRQHGTFLPQTVFRQAPSGKTRKGKKSFRKYEHFFFEHFSPQRGYSKSRRRLSLEGLIETEHAKATTEVRDFRQGSFLTFAALPPAIRRTRAS